MKKNTKSKKKVLLIYESGQILIPIFEKLLIENFIVEKIERSTYWSYIPFFFKLAFKIIKRDKIHKVIVIDSIDSALGAFLAMMIRSEELIYFPYDIVFSYPEGNSIKRKFLRMIEKSVKTNLFLHADKLFHKGLEDELKLLPFYTEIKDRPHYLFREFLDKDKFQSYEPQKKMSFQNEEIHLVYPGGVYSQKNIYIDPFWEFYPVITSQKIHVHIYTKPNSKISKEKLILLDRLDPYFHYEGFLSSENLVKEISKYDYGIFLHNFRFDNESTYYETAVANKQYDYISACLPVIIDSAVTNIKRHVLKYNIGFAIAYKNLNNLKDEILNHNKDYSKYIYNILEYRDRISVGNGKILEFIKEKRRK